MKYLFFDVETTGLPKNYKAPYTQISNWPRIVQLSWIIANEEGKILSEKDNIIKVDFKIPVSASRVHGITNKVSQEKGVDLIPVLNSFRDEVESVDYLICHNVGFDMPVLQSELARNNLAHKISKKTFCTMKNSTHYCKLPGNYGYKWPQLEELHQICFGKSIENAHNALEDVRATYKVFYHLKKENVFTL